MTESLNEHQLIQLAHCLTRMQADMTEFELRHYTELSAAQKRRLEGTLADLAAAAGRLYAYSVQLVFQDAKNQLDQLQQASESLKNFLKTAQKIQQVLDIVSSVASLAEAIISRDVDGIISETDQIIQMAGKS